MEPETLRKWIPVIRDSLIVLIAAFMLLYGTTYVKEPGRLTLIIGGGLTLLGVPAGLRVRDWVQRNGNGKNGGAKKPDLAPGNSGDGLTKEDRWSHMP